MRVLIFVCGEGLGHTTRMISLAQELESGGHKVFFGSYGYSKKLLKTDGFKVFETPEEIVLSGHDGVFDLKNSIWETLKHPVLFKIPKIFKILEKTRPDVVVSDVYYTGILGARLKEIPVFMVTNQANMHEFFQGKGLIVGSIGFLVKLFYKSVFHIVEKIIVPDFPPSKTVCGKNLSFDESVKDKVFYSGPLVRKSSKEKAKTSKRPMVLSTIGGFGYRSVLFEKIIEAARLDENINYIFLLGPTVGKNKYRDIPDNIEVVDFLDNPLSLIRDADVVIASGGHSTIMEAVSVGTPIISCPDIGQCEQENNARGLEEFGIGFGISYDMEPVDILKKIITVLEDDSFRMNALEFSRQYDSLNPGKSVVKLIESGF